MHRRSQGAQGAHAPYQPDPASLTHIQYFHMHCANSIYRYGLCPPSVVLWIRHWKAYAGRFKPDSPDLTVDFLRLEEKPDRAPASCVTGALNGNVQWQMNLALAAV